jgi:hypothetical protein
MHQTDIYPPENTARLTHPSSDLFSHKYNDAIDFDPRNVMTGYCAPYRRQLESARTSNPSYTVLTATIAELNDTIAAIERDLRSGARLRRLAGQQIILKVARSFIYMRHSWGGCDQVIYEACLGKAGRVGRREGVT